MPISLKSRGRKALSDPSSANVRSDIDAGISLGKNVASKYARALLLTVLERQLGLYGHY
jgi:hypothetical protein